MSLTQRNIDILKIIVEEYIETWELLWSKLLLKKYDLGVSPATVRNDMVTLEKLELIHQPYNSAGRLPTAKWLRAFVNYLMEQTPEHLLWEVSVSSGKDDIKKLSDFIHKLVFELAKNTQEIAFFVIPERHVCEYSGVARFLEDNSERMWKEIYSLVKMLEDKFNFMKFIENFPVNPGINVFIWEENILPFFKDYTIILKPVKIDGEIWYIGIIWSLKMNYSFNISAVKGII